jgi:hypothetical protein
MQGDVLEIQGLYERHTGLIHGGKWREAHA